MRFTEAHELRGTREGFDAALDLREKSVFALFLRARVLLRLGSASEKGDFVLRAVCALKQNGGEGLDEGVFPEEAAREELWRKGAGRSGRVTSSVLAAQVALHAKEAVSGEEKGAEKETLQHCQHSARPALKLHQPPTRKALRRFREGAAVALSLGRASLLFPVRCEDEGVRQPGEAQVERSPTDSL